ncbi:MAG: N-acetylmuramic acid 6-phosphate etherase [Ginsengibacter sp.]
MSFVKITEQSSNHRHIEKMSVLQVLSAINEEDKLVADAVAKSLIQIEKLVEAAADKMLAGGRLFYIGAGTSGRLGILDASECPPTFGVSKDLVSGIIAGGKKAITNAVEFAEDDDKQGWKDLKDHQISKKDFVVGIASSGTTPYVIGALKNCRKKGISTGSISCNPDSPLSSAASFPIEVVVGPEFITGSTRMKSGTAQKMILNMISTTLMVQLGRVEDNKMVHMQLSNEKLVKRGIEMLIEKTGIIDVKKATSLLAKYGSVKKAVEKYNQVL